MPTRLGPPPNGSGELNDPARLPMFLNADEAAVLLRTSRKSIYAMVERGQMPGVTRVRRRLLIRTRALLEWLDQQGASSLRERQR